MCIPDWYHHTAPTLLVFKHQAMPQQTYNRLTVTCDWFQATGWAQALLAKQGQQAVLPPFLLLTFTGLDSLKPQLLQMSGLHHNCIPIYLF